MNEIMKVAGIALATLVMEKAMEKAGHGDKTVFVSIIGWTACLLITLDEVMDAKDKVISMFKAW